ncbi:5-methyltetrahydropteroyltriglutamate--homocysteine methyltransferase [Endobacter medicaginis]|uniref:5-methyltetrahydropteroyltriglutamate--homocysteine methyltransferase n=2 Tax=Endobacter medicaginis TaxID=1181271 RepID=A0A839UVR3_9PROT|nr:5-methyltetrahydropteroyltriglutamate--homocysteine S-methyltransferase [Endobacter medicaginis]MBB3172473.1 5-methyltetrahydropteroyltriglutamate--homocysteine methyltransferase [Endobacter medicaginis]MCX5474038.1 5-methyltetrahydropteroyltriglutamate--homocysteine S-methyltransferase [Endobacter medicaginis]
MSSTSNIQVATLGFPRIGPKRELKAALESFWSGKSDAGALIATARTLRSDSWQRQASLGADLLPVGDFALYDQVLDTSVLLGVVPEGLDAYFATARGSRTQPAAEMTKWFDTNYHYIVPELSPEQNFALHPQGLLDALAAAEEAGVTPRPVVIGPVTYLLLAKSHTEGFDPIRLLDRLIPVYQQLFARLAEAGAEWVQIDEPALVLDLSDAARTAYRTAYAAFADAPVKLMLTSYFGALGDNTDLALSLPVAGLHVDLVRAPEQLDAVLAGARADLLLSLGVIDGRNIWRADLAAILNRIEPVVAARGSVVIAPSCSLLHSPIDLDRETEFDDELRSWLAFAVQKISELNILARALREGREAVAAELDAATAALDTRRRSPRIDRADVRARASDPDPALLRRGSEFAERQRAQRERLKLPAFPTTTIGSFPQTEQVRKARADHTAGRIDDAAYEQFLREETARTVAWQEKVGLDALVHGEFERNDMVQYFGEQLDGFAFTRHGWVQSYGSRCVRPPIIYGDVARPAPMTVEWWRYAQSLTAKPMKGMLTGPVTILNWSFVRNDQPRQRTCRQIAFAIRDEVLDLEAAGAPMIQIDEAALREGLPLRRSEWDAYLEWAVACFRIAASGVADTTQIHTHMCYSEFNDIIAAIGAMDADVISIETARSKMELLEAFRSHGYPAEIGPGVYDIHSPRVPAVEDMTELLELATKRLSPDQLWVNPDCGLKTRKWPEVEPAIVAMVEAARRLRETVKTPAPSNAG